MTSFALSIAAGRIPTASDSPEIQAQEFVGQDAEFLTTPMTDDDREMAAYRAGVAMQSWYSQYQHSGIAQHLDLAYHFLGIQKQLLAGRSPEYVARMEAERGLS
jgi:hypothetical protein